ncbi:MAG: GCN5-related N-acetyltransferase [Berkelbacteria bacterium GW2011_GWA1_36_9]|uniref:GCN5-related N-acetyltransferase n=1 Tax=Berkelbacteria bacterium GW2011_GWA1_36_9 TaxID=1618331 RepID=A0A0G0FGW2_9BACT|nr:MAG: GCN5-related N-acetyltransferase [Berkelbacteria bacterium GW2011_GWA1_36_9]
MSSILKIRQAKIEDIPEILIVEDEAWPDGLQATEEMFLSRIETFSEGCFVAENTDRIVGLVVTEIVKYDINAVRCPSWLDITDCGFIRKTHNPEGDSIYGVDLSVSPLASGGASRSLMLAVGKFAIKRNLKQIILGGRMPRYHKYADKMSPEEYLNARTPSGKYLDPEIWFYKKAGLEVIRVIPDYFDDSDSCNNGVLLVWKNPFYNRPFRKFWSWLFRI